MPVIDSFLYQLGFKTDVSGAEQFDRELDKINRDSAITTKHLLAATAAGNLFADALEKGAEKVMEMGRETVHGIENLENMKVSLEGMFGSAAKGKEAFGFLMDFANKNPVMGLDQAYEAFNTLRNNGINPTTDALKTFGDAAAAVPQFRGLLGQGIAELLEGNYQAGGVLSHFGLQIHAEKGGTAYAVHYQDQQGKQQQVELDRTNQQHMWAQLQQILNNRFQGTMAAHADTFMGIMQRFKQERVFAQNELLNNGAWDSFKSSLNDLVDKLHDWEASGEFKTDMKAIADLAQGTAESFAFIVKETVSITGELNKWLEPIGGLKEAVKGLAELYVARKAAGMAGKLLRPGGEKAGSVLGELGKPTIRAAVVNVFGAEVNAGGMGGAGGAGGAAKVEKEIEEEADQGLKKTGWLSRIGRGARGVAGAVLGEDIIGLAANPLVLGAAGVAATGYQLHEINGADAEMKRIDAGKLKYGDASPATRAIFDQKHPEWAASWHRVAGEAANIHKNFPGIPQSAVRQMLLSEGGGMALDIQRIMGSKFYDPYLNAALHPAKKPAPHEAAVQQLPAYASGFTMKDTVINVTANDPAEFANKMMNIYQHSAKSGVTTATNNNTKSPRG
jgi:hypothetical protein